MGIYPWKTMGFSRLSHEELGFHMLWNGFVDQIWPYRKPYSFYSQVILGVFLSIFPYTNTGIEQAQI